MATLGRIPGTNRFSDLERNPENQTVPGVQIFRVESSLLYFNVEYVRETILTRVRSATAPPEVVICDFSASPHVDLQGAVTLSQLADDLSADGIRMQIVEARSSVRDRLRAAGLVDKVRGIDRLGTVAQVVEDLSREAMP